MPKGTPALRKVVRPKYVIRESSNCIPLSIVPGGTTAKNATADLRGRWFRGPSRTDLGVLGCSVYRIIDLTFIRTALNLWT